MRRTLAYALFLGILQACQTKPKPIAIEYQNDWKTLLHDADLTLLEDATITPDSRIWLAGQIIEQRRPQNWLVTLDSNGRMLAQRNWADSSITAWRDLMALPDGHLLLVGEFANDSLSRSLILKTDTSGKVHWTHELRHTYIYSLAQNSQQQCLLTGYTESDSARNENYWVGVLDTSGAIVWDETWGTLEDNESFQQALSLPNGDWLLLGVTTPIQHKKRGDALLVRLSPTGAVLWEKRLGGEEDDFLSNMQTTRDGHILLIGRTRSMGKGKSDIWLLKLNDKGEQVWQQTYGGSFEDWGATVRELPSGNLLLAGKWDINGEGLSDLWLIETTPEGKELWQQRINVGAFDAAYDLLPLSRSHLLLGAGTPDSLGKPAVYLGKWSRK